MKRRGFILVMLTALTALLFINKFFTNNKESKISISNLKDYLPNSYLNTPQDEKFKNYIKERIRLNPDQNLFSLFKNEIKEDYLINKLFILDGWYISLTECYLIELNRF